MWEEGVIKSPPLLSLSQQPDKELLCYWAEERGLLPFYRAKRAPNENPLCFGERKKERRNLRSESRKLRTYSKWPGGEERGRRKNFFLFFFSWRKQKENKNAWKHPIRYEARHFIWKCQTGWGRSLSLYPTQISALNNSHAFTAFAFALLAADIPPLIKEGEREKRSNISCEPPPPSRYRGGSGCGSTVGRLAMVVWGRRVSIYARKTETLPRDRQRWKQEEMRSERSGLM